MSLTKPKFVKVKDLETQRSGYNVLVQVLQADHRIHDAKNGSIPMVDCIVGDESAKVKAFFKGDNTKLINKGNVIAIRNGVKRIIGGNISVEVDIFGRVTEEKDKIVAKADAENISDKKVVFEKSNRPPRQNNRNGPRFRNNQPRKWQNQNNRQNNRNNRNNRNNFQNDRTTRNTRNDRNEKTNRFEKSDRNDRFEKKEKKNYDQDFDRRNNKKGERENRYQQKRYEEKKEYRGDRNPMVKINEMDPGQENMRFIAKVLECKLIQGRFNKLRCLLGDETGTVQAFLPEWPAITVGASLVFSRAEARVVKEHIQIQVPQTGRVEQARNRIEKVNEGFNLSQKSWVPIDS